MKFNKVNLFEGFINEAKVNEISTQAGLDDIVKGRTTSIEGIKMSKELAQGMMDWIKMSPYGKKYGKQILKGRIGSVIKPANAFNIERYLDGKTKKEWKEIYKSVKEAKVNEASDREMAAKVSDTTIEEFEHQVENVSNK